MPNLTVEFRCEGCGCVLQEWTQQTPDSMLRNMREKIGDYYRHLGRHPGSLVCRACQKTVVYDDVIYVEHDPLCGEYAEVQLKASARGNEYFSIGADTMDAMCDAWQRHRRG